MPVQSQAIQNIVDALMARDGVGTGADPSNDQMIFRQPPGAGTTLPPVVDPRMWADPSQLPGDYSRLPYQTAPQWWTGPR